MTRHSTARDALARARQHLDDATENITFDEFRWAFEEAWWGAAAVYDALARRPLAELELGTRGELPTSGSLRRVERRARRLPRRHRLARDFERLRAELAGNEDDIERGSDLAERVVRAVWRAWEVHDMVAERFGPADEHMGDRVIMLSPSPGHATSRAVDRRSALKLLGMSALLPVGACTLKDADAPATTVAPSAEAPRAESSGPAPSVDGPAAEPSAEARATVRAVDRLPGMQWPTSDPFLFCAHHRDDYPAGTEDMAPVASLDGRLLGRDFDNIDGWNMYHGRTVPGFPRHPHRGFETVTVVRTGRLDHADSMGATARYGGGDVQWLTAGGGIQHAEMFPLLKSDQANPLELFQIWMNLPASDKMVPPHFTMLWSEDIPRVAETDAAGRAIELTISAGRYGDHVPPAPPPNSWGAREEADVAIWNVKLAPGARWTLPACAEGTERALYAHRGAGLTVGGTDVAHYHRAILDGNGAIELVAGAEETEVLLLQGRPIGEPVAKRGPFVMNSQDEIRQAYADYQRTEFGGWPWPSNGPVHDRSEGRFARYIDGTFETPG